MLISHSASRARPPRRRRAAKLSRVKPVPTTTSQTSSSNRPAETASLDQFRNREAVHSLFKVPNVVIRAGACRHAGVHDPAGGPGVRLVQEERHLGVRSAPLRPPLHSAADVANPAGRDCLSDPASLSFVFDDGGVSEGYEAVIVRPLSQE